MSYQSWWAITSFLLAQPILHAGVSESSERWCCPRFQRTGFSGNINIWGPIMYSLSLCPCEVCRYCSVFQMTKLRPKGVELTCQRSSTWFKKKKKKALEFKFFCLLTPNSIPSNILSFKILLKHCRNGFKTRRMKWSHIKLPVFNYDSLTHLSSQVILVHWLFLSWFTLLTHIHPTSQLAR